MRRALIVGLGIFILCGCSDGEEHQGEVEHSLADAGGICINTDGLEQLLNEPRCAPLTLPENQPLTIKVRFPICGSITCYRETAIGCKVTLTTENRIVVSSWLTYYTPEPGVDTACTDDCRSVEASCESESLPAGDYVVEHGGLQMPLSLPSERSHLCGWDDTYHTLPGWNDPGMECCDSIADCRSGECRDNVCNPALE